MEQTVVMRQVFLICSHANNCTPLYADAKKPDTLHVISGFKLLNA